MDWSFVVGAAGVIVAVLGWVTSASKSRVENLCKIIDAQSAHIKKLEDDLQAATQRIAGLQSRVTDLERENGRYREILCAEGIDPEKWRQAV